MIENALMQGLRSDVGTSSRGEDFVDIDVKTCFMSAEVTGVK